MKPRIYKLNGKYRCISFRQWWVGVGDSFREAYLDWENHGRLQSDTWKTR